VRLTGKQKYLCDRIGDKMTQLGLPLFLDIDREKAFRPMPLPKVTLFYLTLFVVCVVASFTNVIRDFTALLLVSLSTGGEV